MLAQPGPAGAAGAPGMPMMPPPGAQARAAAAPAAGAEGAGIPMGSPLAQLQQKAQFEQIRAVLQQNPAALQPFLQAIQQQNPGLYEYISTHQEEFMTMLAQPGPAGAAGAPGMPMMPPPGAQVLDRENACPNS